MTENLGGSEKIRKMRETARRVVNLEALQKAVNQLADIHPLEYEQRREIESERLGVRVGVLDAEVERRRRARDGNGGDTEPWPGQSAPLKTGAEDGVAPYAIDRGRIVWVRRLKKADVLEPLCNFVARIVDHRIIDDGSDELLAELLIEGVLSTGRELPPARVRAANFSALNWILSEWGPEAIVSAGQGAKDRLREAIQILSGRVRTRRVFAHSGWRRIDDQPVYLHAGGAIGRDGPVEGIAVELSGDLRRLCLGQAPACADMLNEAVSASLALLRIAPFSVMAPLLGATYLAPLRELLRPEEPDLVPWLHGPSGQKKSEIAALGQSHFGDFPRLRPPASFEATPNAIERILFAAKDALVLVDDYHPAADRRQQERMSAIAVRLLRSAGNLSGRPRMRPDTTLRPELAPRALPLVTGECLPAGHSTVARMFPIPIEPDTVNLKELSQAQARRGLLPIAMGSYVRHVAARHDEFRDRLPSRFRDLRDRALSAVRGHAREPGQVAHLFLGLEAAVEFAVGVTAISRSTADEILADAWSNLLKLALEHASEVHLETPQDLFLALLRDGLVARRIYVETLSGDEPPGPGAWGWEPDVSSEGLPAFRRPRAADRIGFVDDDWVYLLPEAAYRYVTVAARASGRTFPVEMRTLHRRLDEAGWIATAVESGVRRRTVVTHLAALGKSERILKLKRRALEAPTVCGAGNSGNAGVEPGPLETTLTATTGPAADDGSWAEEVV